MCSNICSYICVEIYILIVTCIYMYTSMYGSVVIYIQYIYICVCTGYIYICLYINICLFIYLCIHIYMHMSVYIIQFISTCVYVDTVYIYISHVYMHACTHVSIGFYTYFPGHHFFYLFWSCYFLGVPFWNSRRHQSLEPVSRSNSTSLVCGNEFLDPRKVLQKALTHFPQAPRRWHFDPKLRFEKYQLWWDFLGFIPEICY